MIPGIRHTNDRRVNLGRQKGQFDHQIRRNHGKTHSETSKVLKISHGSSTQEPERVTAAAILTLCSAAGAEKKG